MSDWKPIESAPRHGGYVLCDAHDWDYPLILCWKINDRIVDAHAKGKFLELAETYFGDPNESDDYKLASRDGGPTHWLPITRCPDERVGN